MKLNSSDTLILWSSPLATQSKQDV